MAPKNPNKTPDKKETKRPLSPSSSSNKPAAKRQRPSTKTLVAAAVTAAAASLNAQRPWMVQPTPEPSAYEKLLIDRYGTLEKANAIKAFRAVHYAKAHADFHAKAKKNRAASGYCLSNEQQRERDIERNEAEIEHSRERIPHLEADNETMRHGLAILKQRLSHYADEFDSGRDADRMKTWEQFFNGERDDLEGCGVVVENPMATSEADASGKDTVEVVAAGEDGGDDQKDKVKVENEDEVELVVAGENGGHDDKVKTENEADKVELVAAGEDGGRDEDEKVKLEDEDDKMELEDEDEQAELVAAGQDGGDDENGNDDAEDHGDYWLFLTP